jgi:hypothetical protein
MPQNTDFFEDDEQPPRRRDRDSLMERRMRAARGEQEYPDDDYYEEDDYPPARRAARPVPAMPPPPPPRSGAGCAQATMYLVLGGLATLIIVLLALNYAFSGIGNFFSSTPSINIAGPTATPFFRSNTPIVLRVQQLQRLETTSYTIENVIEAGREGSNVITDQFQRDRILLIARGRVTAGIDLRDLSEEDVMVSSDGMTLTVNLPPVQIFSVTLDNEDTRVYDRDTGLFAEENQNLETQARQEAEDRILETACEDGIMQRAQEDSQRAMEQFLSLLEFENVQVVAANVPACEPPIGEAPAAP